MASLVPAAASCSETLGAGLARCREIQHQEVAGARHRLFRER